MIVVFPGATIDADGVDAVGILTIDGLFDTYVLETVPILSIMVLKETVPPETNF